MLQTASPQVLPMSVEEKECVPLLLALMAKDSPSKTRSFARAAHTAAALSRVGSTDNAGEVETTPKTSAAASAALFAIAANFPH